MEAPLVVLGILVLLFVVVRIYYITKKNSPYNDSTPSRSTQSTNEISESKFKSDTIKIMNACGNNYNQGVTLICGFIIKTILCPVYIITNEQIISNNKYSLCDTSIFTMFIVRLSVMSKMYNKSDIVGFTDEYISKLINGLSVYHNISQNEISTIAYERFSIYDNVMQQNMSISDKTDQMLNILTVLCISNDELKKFTLYNGDELCISDAYSQMRVHAKLLSYYMQIPNLFKDELDKMASYK